MKKRIRQLRKIAAGISIICTILLTTGCANQGDSDIRAVKVKMIKGVSATYGFDCPDKEEGEIDILGMYRIEEAKKAGASAYILNIAPGELLLVGFEGGDNSGSSSFSYRYDGAEQLPLVFSRENFKGLINGKIVYLDLTGTEAKTWLANQPSEALKTVRTIHLNGGLDSDTSALERFASSKVIVMFNNNFSINKCPELIRALTAVKPVGLFTRGTEGLDQILPNFPNLKYLSLSGETIPDLSYLKNLTCLIYRFRKTGTASLTSLAKMTQLRTLCLANCHDPANLSSISRLANLRRLIIAGKQKVENLSALSSLRKLRMLQLQDFEKLKDISAIGNLRNLEEVFFCPLPNSVKDLSPLMRLKNLRILLVDKDTLKNRKNEFDEIKKALPEVKIIGFCMGSAWIFVPVAAAGLYLLWRKLWRKRHCPSTS